MNNNNPKGGEVDVECEGRLIRGLQRLGDTHLRESISLFESIVNSRCFLRTSVVLFLDKLDVFERKLLKTPLERHFPEHAGGTNVQTAAKFILSGFLQANRARLTVYPQ
ncbi:G-protein alpha subunit-domain-containing protein [Mycena galericulata]|nr:G-protein alpha subunit-domain-containing protein [Mycena galericulata]